MKELPIPSRKDAFEEPPQENLYGPRDLVLVMDTSFLIQLGQGNIWASNVWHGIKQKARNEGKHCGSFMPFAVMDEYNEMLATDRRDEYGLPFVHQTLEDVFWDTIEDIEVATSYSATSASEEAWRKHASLRFNPEGSRVRRGPNLPDLSVAAYARTIAEQGAQVYVASYDLKDVIGPLVHDAKRIADEGLMITPIGPSVIETGSFNETRWQDQDGKLRPALNREVIADLQVAKLQPGTSTYVVFERNVHSGDATFDVGVGVAEFQGPRSVQVPERYTENGGKFYLVRALRLHSRYDSGADRLIGSYFQRSKSHPYRLLFVDEQSKFSPLLMNPSKDPKYVYMQSPTFQTTTDFLHYQTDSAYARQHYRPNSRRAKSQR